MGMRKIMLNERGLTLIEVLAGITILVIVLGIGMAALAQSSTLTSEIKGESQERQDMQVGLLELTKAVQEAKDIKKGADDNTFEITNATTKSKYSLVDGQLISNDEGGQTLVEGVRKMMVVDGKGITLEIDGLEEPVVLAQRGGGVIETGLKEKEDWEQREADVICRDGVFEYDRYPQFGEIAKIKKWGSHDTIQCDKERGILTFFEQSEINLTQGDIRIDTNKIVFQYGTNFSLNNGSVYLPYTESVDASRQNKINIPSGKFLVGGKVVLDYNGHINTGDDLIIKGDLNLPNVYNTLSTDGKLIVEGDAILGQNLILTVEKDFIVKGNLSYSVSSISNVKIRGDLLVNGDATFGFNYSHSLGDNIVVGGKLFINNSSEVSSLGDIYVQDDTVIDYKGSIKSGGGLFLNGNVTNQNEVELTSNDDLVIFGNLNNPYKNVLTSEKNIFIKGYAKNGQNSTITSGKVFLVEGHMDLGQDVKLKSGDSIYIKGYLNTGRTVRLTTMNNLYIGNPLDIGPQTKIEVVKDSYVNGKVSFPSNQGDVQGAYFHTGGQLTWTGPTSGSTSENGRALIKAQTQNKVTTIDVKPYFPAFPVNNR